MTHPAVPWLGGTMLLTTFVCMPFFWKRRVLFPRMCVLPGNPQIPLWLARATFVVACVAQGGLVLLPLRSRPASLSSESSSPVLLPATNAALLLQICLVVHCVWALFWALADECILCPQLVHISAACLALACDDGEFLFFRYIA